MSLWIKICGLTSEPGIEAAVAAGADALGFVFARSPRQLSPAHALQLARAVAVPRIAVMLHPTQAQLDEVCELFRPDVLQTDLEDLATLRVPASLDLLPVLRSMPGRGQPDTSVNTPLRAQADARCETRPHESAHAQPALPARLLFEGPRSGAGERADWSAAMQLAARTQLVLAGGLNAANVAEAIRAVRPFGVDVSSGVESAPGVKDPDKIYAFVRQVRTLDNGAIG